MDAIQVLLVEDEALIQTMIEASLKDAGFAVTTGSRGKEAIRLLDSKDAAYKALVTDIDLADDVRGWDIAKHARELNPDMAVVYITGGGHADWPSHGVPNSVLITKPFADAQVVTAVSQLLNQGNTPGA